MWNVFVKLYVIAMAIGSVYTAVLWLQVLYWKIFIINPIHREANKEAKINDKAVEKMYWQMHNEVPINTTPN